MAITNLNEEGRVVSAYLPMSLANALQAKARKHRDPEWAAERVDAAREALGVWS